MKNYNKELIIRELIPIFYRVPSTPKELAKSLKKVERVDIGDERFAIHERPLIDGEFKILSNTQIKNTGLTIVINSRGVNYYYYAQFDGPTYLALTLYGRICPLSKLFFTSFKAGERIL